MNPIKWLARNLGNMLTGSLTTDLCENCEGGVLKRIDENRELLELLQQQAPALLAKAPWIYHWIDSQDAFLTKLADVHGIAHGVAPKGWAGFARRPRPMPARITEGRRA